MATKSPLSTAHANPAGRHLWASQYYCCGQWHTELESVRHTKKAVGAFLAERRAIRHGDVRIVKYLPQGACISITE